MFGGGGQEAKLEELQVKQWFHRNWHKKAVAAEPASSAAAAAAARAAASASKRPMVSSLCVRIVAAAVVETFERSDKG